MKKPFTILAPVDFSAEAANAYRFALNLAAHINATIKVVHVITETPAAVAPGSAPIYTPNIQSIKTKLDQFAEQESSNNPGEAVATKIETEVLKGITVSGALIDYSKNVELIVVGANGQNPLAKKLFGSVPSQLAQYSYCSVLTVPAEVAFYPPSNMLYASNWESSDEAYIEKFIAWVKHFNARANFLHITEEYAMHEFEEVKTAVFEMLDQQEDLHFAYQILDKGATSPLAGIQQYAEEEEMDWISVVNRQKGLFANLFGLSLTKEVISHLQKPILVIKK